MALILAIARRKLPRLSPAPCAPAFGIPFGDKVALSQAIALAVPALNRAAKPHPRTNKTTRVRGGVRAGHVLKIGTTDFLACGHRTACPRAGAGPTNRQAGSSRSNSLGRGKHAPNLRCAPTAPGGGRRKPFKPAPRRLNQGGIHKKRYPRFLQTFPLDFLSRSRREPLKRACGKEVIHNRSRPGEGVANCNKSYS